jgi:hypothetical protein
VLFRYLVTERSLAWMYGHRIDWEARIVPAGEALAAV